MDTKFSKTGKWMVTIILLCILVSSSSAAAQQSQVTTPIEPTGEVINSPTKPQVIPIVNQNQPILGQPSSSSLNQPLTGFNQPSSTGVNQPILGQPSSSSSVNQPLTGFNQPSSTGFNQPISSSPSAQNQPFTNRLNQNSLSGVPFLNGNSKLKVSGTKIVFIWIGLFLALHGTDRN